MKTLARLGFLAALLGIYSMGLAATVAPDNPPFVVLLESQPIVVHAAEPKLARETEKQFPAVPGDVDPSPAYTERYHHYRFTTVETLKGQLPETFEVRTVADRAKWASAMDAAEGFVLVLARDAGAAVEQGTIYLVSHHAAYPVTDGTFRVPTADGQKQWTLAGLREAVGAVAEGRRAREAASPEPAEARDAPVVAGEDEPREEPLLAEATRTRDHGPRPEVALSDAKPTEAAAPVAEDEHPAPQRPMPPWLWWVIAAAVLIVILLAAWRFR